MRAGSLCELVWEWRLTRTRHVRLVTTTTSSATRCSWTSSSTSCITCGVRLRPMSVTRPVERHSRVPTAWRSSPISRYVQHTRGMYKVVCPGKFWRIPRVIFRRMSLMQRVDHRTLVSIVSRSLLILRYVVLGNSGEFLAWHVSEMPLVEPHFHILIAWWSLPYTAWCVWKFLGNSLMEICTGWAFCLMLRVQ